MRVRPRPRDGAPPAPGDGVLRPVRHTSLSSHECRAVAVSRPPGALAASQGAEVSVHVFFELPSPVPGFVRSDSESLVWSGSRGWGFQGVMRVAWRGLLDGLSAPGNGSLGLPPWAIAAVVAAVPDPELEALSLAVMES